MNRSLPARLVVALAATTLCSGLAVAQEGVAFKNLMGNMGILPKEKDPIRYRERAPLVIPPKAELRPPAPTGGLAATNPQWPNDPDVAERRRRADDERRPVTWSETRRMSENNVMLTPDELRRGRIATNPDSVPGTHRGDNARDVLVLSPDQMRAGSKREGDVAVAGAEPGRKVLTDPPTGMRRSATGGVIRGETSTPKGDQQALDANPMTWLRRRFSNDEDE